MSKKKAFLLMSSLTLGVLAACGNNTDNTEEGGDGSGDVTIQFMTSSVEQERLTVIEGMIDRFEEENEGVTVETVPVEEGQYNTNVVTLAQAGELPAVIEVGQDFAKTMANEQLIDVEATTQLVEDIGPQSYYEGALNLLSSEDGEGYLGVPLSGWVQGIWYSQSKLEEAGIEEPANWEELLSAAEQLTDTANNQYGIALPTVEGPFSEQGFSQFALSNNANILDNEGNLDLDTSEMREALEMYQQLAEYTMPGSNDTTQVNDAFSNGSAAMALYSTYILPGIYENGDPSDIGFIIPTEESEAVYGSVTALTISGGLEQAEKDAAEAFIAFMSEPENMTEWVLMSPGGAQPVSDEVTNSEEYQNNEVVQAFGELSTEIAGSFDAIQVFGLVEGQNFTHMGAITGSNAIGTLINQITVGDASIDEAIERAQSTIEDVMPE
ncbi:ABC transporter substrate-binding protein [Desemzia sp. FAM 24101]|uniref:ABC transporter substrate-binding protein n=1 Tax=unclassified Desemzia TaxID=2685243 RepID=UPI00388A143D